MTYKDLLEQLETLPKERLEDTVTVYDAYEDEYIPVIETDIAQEIETNVLDEGHFYLILKA